MTSRPATATPVRPRSTAKRQSRASRLVGMVFWLAVIAAFVAALVVADARWTVPEWIAMLYLALSILCFIVYAVDKSAAVAGRWRISENTLLGLGLIGGWPGAILAQQFLRHKVRKRHFMVVFGGTVVANVGVLGLLLSPLGSGLLSSVVATLF